MGGLSRKALNLKIRTLTKKAVQKNINFQPVIRKVDVAALKESMAKSSPKKAEVKEVEPSAKIATTEKVAAKKEAPKKEGSTAEKKAPKAIAKPAPKAN